MTVELLDIEEYLKSFNLDLPISLDLSNIDLRYENFNLLYDKYLKNFSTITDLDLSHNTCLDLDKYKMINIKSEEIILNIIKNNPSLSSLNLSYVNLSNIDKILHILQNRTNLIKLKLKECFNFNSNELNLLIDVIQNNTLLTKLSFNYWFYDDKEIFEKLFQTIKNHLSLNNLTLQLASHPIIFKSLYKLLKDNSTLKIRLTITFLNYNYIEDLKLIYKLLKNNSSIIKFYPKLNWINSNYFLTFNNMLSLNSSSLNKLRINHSGRNISEIMQILCNTLKFNTTLTDLQLNNNNIKDNDIKPLCELLQTNTTLTKLNLSNNDITDDGLKLLSDVLKVNTTLTELILMNNQFANNGYISLGEVLKVNTSLVKLQICSSPFTSIQNFNKLLLLFESLKFNNTLTETDIYDYYMFSPKFNLIEDVMIETLKYNTTLTKLSYLHCKY